MHNSVQGTASGDGRGETAAKRADRNWSEILQELRVSQTGTQILSGFLLTLAFQPRFKELDTYQVVVYGVLVILAAASTALGLATVALHRQRFHKHDKPRLVSIASRLLGFTVAVVAVLTTGVLLLIFDVVFGRAAGLIAGAATAVTLALLLFVIPTSLSAGRARLGSEPVAALERDERPDVQTDDDHGDGQPAE